MQILAVTVLLVSALFNLVAWPRFYPRIAKDPRARDAAGRATRFLKVHVVLIVIAIVIAVVCVAAAIGLLAAG